MDRRIFVRACAIGRTKSGRVALPELWAPSLDFRGHSNEFGATNECLLGGSMRNAVVALALLFLARLCLAAAPATDDRRPNIVVIVLDDVGYSDVGSFGSEIRTPAIDAIAAGGLRYNRFDTKAVCSPT